MCYGKDQQAWDGFVREDEEVTTMQVGRSNDHTDKGTVAQDPSKTNRARLVTVTDQPTVQRSDTGKVLSSRSIQEAQSATQDRQRPELVTDLPTVLLRQGLGPGPELKWSKWTRGGGCTGEDLRCSQGKQT